MTSDNATQANQQVGGRRGGVGVPLLVALGVVTAMIAGFVVQILANQIGTVLYEVQSDPSDGISDQALGYIQAGLETFGTRILPVGVGIFVTLRLITPVSAGLWLRTVVIRSVIAALIGVAAAFVVISLYGIVNHFQVDGSLFGHAFPGISAPGLDVIYGLVGAVASAISLLIEVVPLTLLAGILVWIGLGRRAAADTGSDTRAHV
ncbi:hypothetical protein [Glaciihabitans sp. dw_435]|uniref:hypothetical protein n=1 Tax=Glaciihabitans sp. dw_435 TaxID=2720081 RepID=UPI001BD5EA67|nr:hypothetical protein [Glaciihabitans sp. dw_435]